jgi:hypothetical protein
MNNSLFSAIRNTKSKNILPEICKLENGYLKVRSKMKYELKYEQLERTIEDTIRILIKANVLTIEQSVN